MNEEVKKHTIFGTRIYMRNGEECVRWKHHHFKFIMSFDLLLILLFLWKNRMKNVYGMKGWNLFMKILCKVMNKWIIYLLILWNNIISIPKLMERMKGFRWKTVTLNFKFILLFILFFKDFYSSMTWIKKPLDLKLWFFKNGLITNEIIAFSIIF